MAQTLREVDALFAAAERCGVVFHDALTVRSEKQHRIVKQNLPRIGRAVCSRIRYFGGTKGWYTDEKVRGSMFLCLHMHFVDQYIDLFGDPQWVDATRFVADRDGSIHSGTIMLGFAGDTLGYVEFGMGFPKRPVPDFCVIGTRGLIEFAGDFGDPQKKIVLKNEEGEFFFEAPSDPTKPALKEHSDNFVDRVLKGAPPLVSHADSRRAIEVCLLAERSAKRGSRIKC
jgi:predicted dehydrogenase